MLSVVFVGAHPDDESVLVGGTLALLAKEGQETAVITATRGEGGELGEPPVTTREQIGATREAELRQACVALGVQFLYFLDYVDPLIGSDDMLSAFEADEETLVQQIRDHIQSLGATVVLTHGSDGEYGHPAHQLIHRAVMAATVDLDCVVYSVAAYVPDQEEDRLWNKNDRAHLVLDISPWGRQKLAAMQAHVSQHALFKRRKKLTTLREAVRHIESFRRQQPALSQASALDDAFAAFLLQAGAYRVAEDDND